MKTFDVMIPYSIYDGDPVLLDTVMNEFSDYVLDKYRKLIDEYLNQANRYQQYKRMYGQPLKEYAVSKGYPEDIEISGSLLVDSMVKKEVYGGILCTVSSTKRPRGSRIPVDQFIRMVEYGSSKFPALNILRRANREINSNIRRYYEEYRRESSGRSRKLNDRYRKI